MAIKHRGLLKLIHLPEKCFNKGKLPRWFYFNGGVIRFKISDNIAA